jgi:hypothetical protein
MSHTWRTLSAAHHSGLRPAPPSLVVVHCTQGATAEGAARWFANPRSAGSAHVVVDDTEVWRCVDDMVIAWHARGHNTIGLGLEIAGFAQWTETEWMARHPRLREAARIHAGWNTKYGIPLVRSSTRGYHPHAGLPGNDHWDPGPGFPWAFYLGEVRRFMRLAGAPAPPKRPHGNTLRLVLNGRAWSGWEACIGPMRWIARNGLRADARVAFAWRGAIWRDPGDVPKVIRTVLSRYA